MDSIRLLEERDIPAALDIIQANYPDEDLRALALTDLRAMFVPDAWVRPTFLVMESEGTLVAFAGYSVMGLDYDGYGIYWVNVAPVQQGKGFGTRLIEALLERLRTEPQERGYVMLSCKRSLRSFYEAFGFSVVKERQIAGVEKYLMQVELWPKEINPA